MPGFDQKQATLIALQDLKAALTGFALVPQEIAAQQAQLLAQLTEKFTKSPSVFAGGLGNDFRNNYLVASPSSGSSAQDQFWIATGAENVRILDLQSASKVRVQIVLSAPQVSFIVAGYALSPNDSSTQIPLSQFSVLGGRSFSFLPDDPTGLYNGCLFIADEIPCDGNRYLHLMGGVLTSPNDLWSLNDASNGLPITNPPYIVISYSLIK